MRALINIKLPLDEDGQFIKTKEFRQLLQIIGLRPTDMPAEDGEEAFKIYCRKRAEPIFDRMPENTEEEKIKKQFSRDNIVYASDLPQSNTIFMISAHTDSEYRFRLLNPKIESLQAGCKDLVLKLRAYNEKHINKKIEIVGDIEIYEHGLEESTISGTVIYSRWKTALAMSGRDVLIATAGLLFFIALTGINYNNLVGTETEFLYTVVDRLSTAMFTAMIVSLITVVYTFRELVPVIKWTTSYER